MQSYLVILAANVANFSEARCLDSQMGVMHPKSETLLKRQNSFDVAWTHLAKLLTSPTPISQQWDNFILTGVPDKWDQGNLSKGC